MSEVIARMIVENSLEHVRVVCHPSMSSKFSQQSLDSFDIS